MDKTNEIIEDYYFVMGKNVVEIANILDVSKQYISKILKNNFYTRYEEEKLRRKTENKQKRNKQKSQKMAEKRKGEYNTYMVNIGDLRRQQEIHARMMSNNRILSTQKAVYSNINAYNLKENMLVFNESLGKKPNDLPEKFSIMTKI